MEVMTFLVVMVSLVVASFSYFTGRDWHFMAFVTIFNLLAASL